MAEASRRSFFKYVTMFLGGVISVVIGGNATRYFIAPAWKQKRETWIKVAQFHVLPNGIPVLKLYPAQVRWLDDYSGIGFCLVIAGKRKSDRLQS